MANPRLVAAKALAAILTRGRTLAQLLPASIKEVPERDQGLLNELCYGCCRWYPRLKQVYLQLIDKPLKAKDADIEALIFIGLYQLTYTRIPAHAAINETVDCAKLLKKHWAVKFVNGVLREFQRRQESLFNVADANPQGQWAHPNWLIKAITEHWPDQAEQIFHANNQHPPFTLRVNGTHLNRDDYLLQLQEAGLDGAPCVFSDVGITLNSACSVNELPGFADGLVSVQDEAAQLAANLLNLEPGQRVLDACAAPGGKTCHLLEVEPNLRQCVALDISDKRLHKVAENLNRVHPNWPERVAMIAADALEPEHWNADGELFDRILLDAPCSATGVIRRHPDIKLLRLANQVEQLAQLQSQLLASLWQQLKPGGQLVYATCSIFPQENTLVVEQFLERTPNAELLAMDVPWGLEQPAGRQLLPQLTGHDGFFYARLHKVN